MIQLFKGAIRTGNRVHSVTLYIKDGPADVQAAQSYPDVHLYRGFPAGRDCWCLFLGALGHPYTELNTEPSTLFLSVSYC